MRIVLCVVFTLFVGVSCSATEIVVDPSGGGDSLTIQGGVDTAMPGDSVIVLPGTYYENITMKGRVELIGASGAESTIIDMGGGLGINCEQTGPGVRIKGFTLTNGGGYCGGGVRLWNGCSAEIAHCRFTGNHTDYESAGIHVHDNCYADIHDNVFDNNTSYHSVCISVIVQSIADIYDNRFEHNVSEFLSAGVGINNSSAHIEGNVFYRNESNNGSAVRSWSGNMTLINNSFLYNSSRTEAADVSARFSSATLDHNLFAYPESGPAVIADFGVDAVCNAFWGYFGNEYQGSGDIIGVDGNEVVDPLLCVAGIEEAALSEYSPCLTGPCGVIGANADPNCTDAVPTTRLSWSELKRTY